MQMFAAEHFVRTHHVWTCTACPVHDPRTGELLGVVDVSGPAETVHPTTVALVGTAVKLAEASLWRQYEGRLETLRGRRRAAAVRALRARAGGRRPRLGRRGHRHAQPGAHRRAARRPADRGPRRRGVRARAGARWLAAARERTPPRIRLTLDLDHRPPRAVVDGSSRWLHPLSTRHAEVLLLLAAAGATGMDAGALSAALYGDRDHLVTVRAEMSRLRRSLGGLLLARPYRIAPQVEVVPPDLAGAAVPLHGTGRPSPRRREVGAATRVQLLSCCLGRSELGHAGRRSPVEARRRGCSRAG